jgi:hypothetical protein
MKIYTLSIAVLILLIMGTAGAWTTPQLTLTLNNTMDGSSTPLVNNITNITSAVLLDTSGNTVELATTISPDNMTAQFDLSGIIPGDYFINVNNHVGALVPTRIDSNASDIIQSVGRRLRNSVIGDISNPAYRIKSYPSEISSSHPVVNYVTGANESKYAFVIVPGSTNKIEVRVLNTSEELSNFSAAKTTHDGQSVSFQNWILGDVEDTNGAVIGNHGRLYNASTDPTTMVCSMCHTNLGTQPATFSAIVPGNGWCFRCHNGPGGPSQGFVDPIVQVHVANGTIAGNVTNVSSGSAIVGATVAAGTQSNITDVNGNYSISIAPGIYNVVASATGYQSNSTNVTVNSGATATQDFALTPAAISPALTTIIVSPSTASLTAGTNVAFNATALNGSVPMAGVNVSWNVSNTTVGSISVLSGITGADGNTTVIFTASAVGITLVNATNGSISDSASITVNPVIPVLTSIVVTPSSGNLSVAGTQVFNATALNGSTPMAGVNISWNVSNMTVGSVSVSSGITGADGNTTVIFTASAVGITLVNATNGSISGSASVNVPIPVLTSITISPTSAVLDKNTTQVFTATAKDQMNSPMQGINITWTSSNPSLGTLSNASSMTGADGNASTTFSPASTGNTTITATNGSNMANATVIIADRIINLNMGWNLISIPNFAAPNSVAQALANVQYNAIWEFDSATMNFTTPSVLNPLKGYWINVTASDQSIGFISGTVILSTPPTGNLYEGWNLIGVAASHNDDPSVPLNASVVFAGLQNEQVGPLYSMLVSYEDIANPHTFIVGSDLTPTTPLNQGHGYWLFINPLVNYPRNNVLWAGTAW